MTIAALESQITALVLVNRKEDGCCFYEEDETDAEDTLSRVSSLGVGSIITNHQPPTPTPRTITAGTTLLPPASASTLQPSKKTGTTNNKVPNNGGKLIQQQQQCSSAEDDDEDESNSPAKKTKSNNNARLPPAYPSSSSKAPPPVRNPASDKMSPPPVPSSKKNNGKKDSNHGCTTKKDCINHCITNGSNHRYDNEEKEDDSGYDKTAGRCTFKRDKAAIKALPRELSIYNNDDDDVTKYSIDDGHPTYQVEKSEFRDAYNVRGIYTGTIHRSSGMPHGFGTMIYHLGGRYYEGNWHMGHWHGTGIFRNQEGDVYEGHMVNDLKEGTGKLTYADGRIFEGMFDDDEAVQGTIQFPDGAKYVGQLHNGARHGKGVYYFNDGSVYEGESVMNVFEGKGKMTWNDGGWYEGEWTQGEIHGYGKEIRPDGSLRHEGRWNKGMPIRQ